MTLPNSNPSRKPSADGKASLAAIAPTLYDTDFCAWVKQQADALRAQQWDHIDLPSLVEEIESLGKQQRQELRNRLSVLLAHLLKWQFQPQGRSRSWLATLRVQRREIQALLSDSPSLKPYVEEALAIAYASARDIAMGETNLPVAAFPSVCPYKLDDLLADGFYPGDPSDLLDA